MSYPITSLDGLEVIGNSQTRCCHCAKRVFQNRVLDTQLNEHHLVALTPDGVKQAVREGFTPCRHCAI